MTQFRKKKSKPSQKPKDGLLYGTHACEAALRNPQRPCHHLYLTKNASPGVEAAAKERGVSIEFCSEEDLEGLLPPSAVHQGVALKADPLPFAHLEDVLKEAPEKALILVLDQIQDPQNMGAILRSAVAFGVSAVVFPKHQSSPVTGAAAKSASGALELVPLCQVSNLVQALEKLKKAGFWCYGLAESNTVMTAVDFPERTALIVGSEGKGLRQLTKETCDELVAIPTQSRFTTLNASNAAAVALFHCYQSLKLGEI